MNVNERKRLNYKKRKEASSKKCVVCGESTFKQYCSYKCQHKHKEIIIFQRIENGDDLVELTDGYTKSRWFKRYLISKCGEKCIECGWDKKHPITNKVPIELEHVDGNSENNKLENLKLLCPNCHSLTPTFKGLNRGKGRSKRKKWISNSTDRMSVF